MNIVAKRLVDSAPKSAYQVAKKLSYELFAIVVNELAEKDVWALYVSARETNDRDYIQLAGRKLVEKDLTKAYREAVSSKDRELLHIIKQGLIDLYPQFTELKEEIDKLVY